MGNESNARPPSVLSKTSAQPSGCVERSRSSEATRNHQPTAALSGETKNVWSTLPGLHRERTENRPITIRATKSFSHYRNLRATSDQSHHSPLGEAGAIRSGVQRRRSVVSRIAQRKCTEKGQAPSRSYDRQDSPHHELGLQAWSATQLCAATARRQSDELGKPTDDQRLQGAHHDAEAGVRGSSEHTGAETNAHAERRCYGVAGVGIAGIDVDGSGFRRVGELCEAGLRVGKVQATEVKSLEGSGSPAPTIGWFHARMARKNALSQGQRLRVPKREAWGQEAAVSIHHGAEVPETRSHQGRCNCGRLERSFRLSQFSPLTGNGAGEAESGSQDGAGYAASRGLRHHHGGVCTVRHGVDAGCAREVPGTADGRQNSPAHGASSVRIMGLIVGWKFRLSAAKFFRMMVARDGVEPPTPAVSGLRSTT